MVQPTRRERHRRRQVTGDHGVPIVVAAPTCHVAIEVPGTGTLSARGDFRLSRQIGGHGTLITAPTPTLDNMVLCHTTPIVVSSDNAFHGFARLQMIFGVPAVSKTGDLTCIRHGTSGLGITCQLGHGVRNLGHRRYLFISPADDFSRHVIGGDCQLRETQLQQDPPGPA